MTEKQFDKIVKETTETIIKTLVVKGKEYRRNKNVFHNFEVGAKMTGKIREEVLNGFALKHQISIADMRDDLTKGILPIRHMVEEKYNDAIIYLILEKASMLDRICSHDRVRQIQLEDDTATND